MKYNFGWDLKTAKRICLLVLFVIPYFVLYAASTISTILFDKLENLIIKMSR